MKEEIMVEKDSDSDRFGSPEENKANGFQLVRPVNISYQKTIYFLMKLSLLCGIAVTMIGGLVVINWGLDLAVFNDVEEVVSPMSFSLGIFFFLSGLSLVLFNLRKNYLFIARIISSLVLLFGIYDIFIFLFQLPAIGIISRNQPQELYINLTMGIILVGISLVTIDLKVKYKNMFSQLIALLLLFAILFSMVGSSLNFSELSVYSQLTNMSILSAICFFIISLGITFTRPQYGLMDIVLKNSEGGKMIRLILAVIFFIPVMLICLYFISLYNIIDRELFGIQLVVFAVVAAFIFLVWRVAVLINKLEMNYRLINNKISDSNERFLLAAKAADFGVWDYNAVTGKAIWDDKMLEIYGVDRNSEEDWVKVWKDSLHPEDKEKGLEEVDAALANERMYDTEYRIIRPDGKIRHIKSVGKVIYDEKGNATRMTGLSYDQTEGRIAEIELAESEKKYKYLFNENPIPIWIFDEKSLQFIEVNDAAVHDYGFSKEEFLKMNFLDVRPAEDRAKAKNLVEAEPIEKHKGIWRHLKKTGEIVYVDVKALRFEYGDHMARMVMSNDVTQQKKHEETIRQKNVELKDNVTLKAKQLKDSNDEQVAFSYSVAHDLRAPLRHIVGFSQKLERQLIEMNISPEVNRLTGKIKDSALKLGQLIDELLMFSKLGRTDIMKRPADVKRIVQEVIDEYTEPYPKEKVEWVVKSMPEVNGDVTLLRLVFQNLINNALKFSARKEKIQIEINCERLKNEYIFSVKDNGAGFNMEYADKLFGVFQRLHSNDEFPGIGIGLATVSKIIKKHNGRIWAEGKIDEGAIFYFSIPR